MMKRPVPGSKLQVCRLSGPFLFVFIRAIRGEYNRAA